MRSQVHIPSRRAERKLILELCLPDTYPSHCAPGLKVNAPHLDGELQSWVSRELKDLFQPGACDSPMAAYTEPVGGRAAPRDFCSGLNTKHQGNPVFHITLVLLVLNLATACRGSGTAFVGGVAQGAAASLGVSNHCGL